MLDQSELYEGVQFVGYAPSIDHLSALHLVDGDARNPNRLVGRRNLAQASMCCFARVRAVHGPARNHFVSLGNYVLDFQLHIRNAALAARNASWWVS